VFIKYCFEVGESSPFFQGMNYNGRHCGFTNDSHSFSYRDWLPNAKQVFLEGPCNKESPQRFELTPQGNGFFDLKVEEHFETFANGDTVIDSIKEGSASNH
jgi:1,4-alpha-glucan branching enzyme